MSNRPRNNEKRLAKLARRKAQLLTASSNLIEAEIYAHVARTNGARAKTWLARYESGLQQIGMGNRPMESLYAVPSAS
jgi:hypothetical protein